MIGLATALAWLVAAPPDAPGEPPAPTGPTLGPTLAPTLGPPLAPPSPVRLYGRWIEHLGWRLDEDAPSPLEVHPVPGAVDPLPAYGLGRVASQLSLGLDWSAGEHWEGAFEVRVHHAVELADDDGATWRADIVRAAARWRPNVGRELSLGYDAFRWGHTLSRPFDVMNPLELRDGPLPPEGGERRSIFALAWRESVGDGEILALWSPLVERARLPGPRLQDDPEVTIGEAAVRGSQRFGPFDLALGWAWRFDRRREIPGVPAATGGDSIALDVPRRQHLLGAELAWRAGDWRVLGELALFLDQHLWAVADLAPVTAPLARWELDLGWTPAPFFELTVGLEGAHTLRAAPATWLEGPGDLWLRARLSLMLAYDGVVRLDGETRVGLRRDDHWLSLALVVRATKALELALGWQRFDGDPLDGGLGALYDGADEAWMRTSLGF